MSDLVLLLAVAALAVCGLLLINLPQATAAAVGVLARGVAGLLGTAVLLLGAAALLIGLVDAPMDVNGHECGTARTDQTAAQEIGHLAPVWPSTRPVPLIPRTVVPRTVVSARSPGCLAVEPR